MVAIFECKDLGSILETCDPPSHPVLDKSWWPCPSGIIGYREMDVPHVHNLQSFQDPGIVRDIPKVAR